MRLSGTRLGLLSVLAVGVFSFGGHSLASLEISPTPLEEKTGGPVFTSEGMRQTPAQIVRQFGIETYYEQFQGKVAEIEEVSPAEPIEIADSIVIEEIEQVEEESAPEPFFIDEEVEIEAAQEPAAELTEDFLQGLEQNVNGDITEDASETIETDMTPSVSEELPVLVEEEETETVMEETVLPTEEAPVPMEQAEMIDAPQLPQVKAFDIEGYYAQFAPKEETTEMAAPVMEEPVYAQQPLSARISADDMQVEPAPQSKAQQPEIIVIEQENNADEQLAQEMDHLKRQNMQLEQRILELEANNHALAKRMDSQQQPSTPAQEPLQARMQAEPEPQPAPVYEPAEALMSEQVQVALAQPEAGPVYLSDEPGFARDWFAQQGQSLRDVLTAWSKDDGVQLIWDLELDFTVPKTLNVRAAYASAVRALLGEYPQNGLRPVGSLHIDPDTQERILVIQKSDI